MLKVDSAPPFNPPYWPAMPSLWIDDREIPFSDGATILDVAKSAGIDIPTLCYRDGCSPSTSCLVCVVRLPSGALVPSCATKAVDGLHVECDTEEVRRVRRAALELLLSDHLGDCLAPCRSGLPGGNGHSGHAPRHCRGRCRKGRRDCPPRYRHSGRARKNLPGSVRKNLSSWDA